jgi:hypothetical protein
VPSSSPDCFFTAVASAYLEASSSPESIEEFSRLGVKRGKLTGPIHVKQISHFESLNAEILNVAVNVYTIDGTGAIYNVHLSNRRARSGIKQLNLLLVRLVKDVGEDDGDDDEEYNKDIIDDEDEDSAQAVEYHYLAINNLQKFLSIQRSGQSRWQYTCHLCMAVFNQEYLKKDHLEFCSKKDPQRVILPEPIRDKEKEKEEEEEEEEFGAIGNPMKFTDHQKRAAHPLFAVADFEASMQMPSLDEDAAFNSASCHALQMQKAVSYCILVYDIFGKLLFKRTKIMKEGLMDNFFETLNKLSAILESVLNKQAEAKISVQSAERLKAATSECWVCLKDFEPGEQKCLDHCHYSGKVRGIAHEDCNLAMRRQKKVPIYIHNFGKYDQNFVLSALSTIKKPSQYRPRGLAHNNERFRTLEFNSNLLFLDSRAFFPEALGTMAQELVKSEHEFPLLSDSKLFATQEQKQLLLKKGVFPYEDLTDVDEFCGRTEFPPIANFHSTLSGPISQSEWEHGRRVYETFNMNNMGEYLHLYQELDCYLLAEIVNKFRIFTMTHFKVDMLQYISLPACSFSSMLFLTDAKIELLSDIDQLTFFESSLRGGVAYANTRYVVRKEGEEIVFVDANALYALGMSLPLPVSGFAWMTEDELQQFDLTAQLEDQPEGYVLEVDMEYPEELHDLHSSCPVAPGPLVITNDHISPYSAKQFARSRGVPLFAEGEEGEEGEEYGFQLQEKKLTGTFLPQKKYIGHYSSLAYYAELGLKITKIHRGIKFKQAPYMKPFIDLCSRLRANCETSFEKKLCKLFTCSNYGKTIQNQRNFTDTRICTKRSQFMRLAQSPFFKHFRILSEDVVIVHMKKKSVKMDRPLSSGFAILEHSKTHMAKKLYSTIMPAFGNDPKNCEVLFSDTDSYIMRIKGESSAKILAKLNEIMDYSNYDSRMPNYDGGHRRNVPGFFKDELLGRYIILEAIFLRAKCYSLLLGPNPAYVDILTPEERETFLATFTFEKTTNKCKGISYIVSRNTPFAAYLDTLFLDRTHFATMHNIISKKHVLATVEMRKKHLDNYDSKRHLLDCGIHSYPYGSVNIKKYGNICLREDCKADVAAATARATAGILAEAAVLEAAAAAPMEH